MASSSPSSSTLRHVAMLPFMGKGHAMPMLHLTRLLLHRGLASAVTVLATPREAPFIRAAVAGVPGAAVLELPFPSSYSGPQSMEELPSASDSHFLDLISATAALRPAFADALAQLRPRPDLLVHDGFLPWAKDAADGLGVPRLVSHGMGAFSCYATLAVLIQKPHARVSSPWEPFEVDGLPGLQLTTADLSPPFDDLEPAGRHWDFICESGVAMNSSRGTILNSFHELESLYIDKMNQLENSPAMWPVGPLCLAAEPAVQTNLDADLAGWLDSRLAMNRPVLYVAFGSQANLSRAQLEEIAAGLDRSGVDFLWVVRSKWFYGEDPVEVEGRFGDRGKVEQRFVDQLGVLRHKAIRGFFSHCGWNSVTESISMGVPILAFPLAAEQKMNAKFVVDVLGAGLRVWPSRRGDGGGGDGDGSEGAGELVASQDIGALARELILGERGKHAAARAAELAASARTAMDAGGSSYENLELMVRAVTSDTSRVEASSE
jgi:hypothetical protein